MGCAHGQRFRDEIRLFTEERVRLCSSLDWTGRELSREAVIALAESCVAEHQAYAPDLMQELRGIADATGLTLAELVINNAPPSWCQRAAAPLDKPISAKLGICTPQPRPSSF